ncbi:MAG: hypothetical protein OXR73_31435 [Myxococcales bacterium]|nr:hypothetical protein [Myxococcales bacterium]
MGKQLVVWGGTLCLLLCGACGDCGSKSKRTGSDRTTGGPATAKTVVTGRVKLAPGHSLPAYSLEDMERKVLTNARRGEWPKGCTPPKLADRRPVQLTPDGYLKGVMVGATGFKTASPRPPKVHDVTIEDCRLTPSLVVAVKGDVLRIRNNVDFPFMPTFGPATVARTLMPEQKFEVDLDRGGVESVLCGFTAPCGRTDVVTIYHPVYALTDSQGRFRIEDFPPDQPVELNAWHPLFEANKIEFTAELGEIKEVELVVAPKQRFTRVDAGTKAKGKAGGPRPGTSIGTPIGADSE